MSGNLAAFLSVIAHCEGTAGPDGYRTLFGGDLFAGFADHPRIIVERSGYRSSAAGHYQLRVIENGTGGFSVTWAGSAYASTRWGGSGAAPSLNTTAAGVSVVNFWFDGTNLYQTLFRVGMA